MTQLNIFQLSSNKFFGYFLVVLFLQSCATSGSSTSAYGVGPVAIQTNSNPETSSTVSQPTFEGYSVSIPPFDPNIPNDPEDYERLGIWPEVRRTEAIRIANELKEKLDGSGMVAAARVTPSVRATSHFYVNGKILESNGEDLRLSVELVDITGRSRMSKNYRHRVGSYDDPRATSRNLHAPLMDEISEDVRRTISRIRERDRETITRVERMRFAESFQPSYFSQFLDTNRRGRTRLLSFPAEDDAMLERIELLKIKDQLFIDDIQKEYSDFTADSNNPFFTWQQQALVETRAAREARARARGNLLAGIAAVAIGAAIAADAPAYSTTADVGAAVAVVGAVAAGAAAIENLRDARSHVDTLNEIGESLNIQIAPKVMEIEDQQVELRGNAEEQYLQWRQYLTDFYDLERTPDRQL